MYLTFEKVTARGFPSLIISLFSLALVLITIGATVTLVLTAVSGGFNKLILFLTLLLWGETIGTLMTFNANVVDGPNSALLNLPLFACDLVFVVLASNTVCTIFDYFDMSSAAFDPNKWQFSSGDFFRLMFFVVAIIRYVGLAWTDHNFFLKRLVAPVRRDQVKEFVPTGFDQFNDPFSGMMPVPPMPAPM